MVTIFVFFAIGSAWFAFLFLVSKNVVVKQQGFPLCTVILANSEGGTEMFIVGASYLSLLQAVVAGCALLMCPS